MRPWLPRRTIVVVALGGGIAACNALSGVGELETAPCTDCGDDATIRAEPEASIGDAQHDARDASSSTSDVASRPSYCNGIVMYLRFDGSITTSQGVPPETPPATTFVPGKFGMGAVLAGANGALYYVVSDAGVPYPMTAGTMAMWFKPQWTWPSATGRVIWKPVVDRGGVSNQAGPYMAASAEAFFGTVNTNPDGGTVGAVSTGAQLTPYWKNADWNHLAETWSQSAPTLTFTLNGATGDATVTHVEANDGWVRQFPNVGYVRLASNGSPSDGQYDDVAMWNRALSLAEVQAIYSANKPIGDLCGL